MADTIAIKRREFRVGAWYAARSGSGQSRKLLEVSQGIVEHDLVVWFENSRGMCAWVSPAKWCWWVSDCVDQPANYTPERHRRLPSDWYRR